MTRTFVAECYWPGTDATAVEAAGGRIRLAAQGSSVRYAGSLHMVEDDVVFLELEAGSGDELRRVLEAADLPFDRVVAVVRR